MKLLTGLHLSKLTALARCQSGVSTLWSRRASQRSSTISEAYRRNNGSTDRASAKRGRRMITLEDCIGLCGLTEEEVLAIAEHEHIPQIVATALSQYLLSQAHGSEKIR